MKEGNLRMPQQDRKLANYSHGLFHSFLACLPDPLPICMRRKSEEEEEEERREREDCRGAVRSCVAFFLERWPSFSQRTEERRKRISENE